MEAKGKMEACGHNNVLFKETCDGTGWSDKTQILSFF